jgi:esterase
MSTVSLHAQVVGEGEPLVILHGLFGSARNWASIARRLAEIRQVHALDLRNHGNSPWADSMSYEEMAADVAASIEGVQRGPVDLLGHSMGGKAAMVLALTRPELIRRLIIVDIAPVPYPHDEGFGRYLAAMRAIDLSRLQRRADADAALATAIPDPTLRAFLLQNLVSQHGHFRWRANLDAIGANLPAITGFPDTGEPFTGPTTFIAGERSDYIRPRDEIAIRRLFPEARLVEIGQAGHWAHAERPDRFVELVSEALAAPS